MNKKIITKYMMNTKRIKATIGTTSKYTNWDDGQDEDKNHEIAAYNLMCQMHLSVKWMMQKVKGDIYQIEWKMIPRK